MTDTYPATARHSTGETDEAYWFFDSLMVIRADHPGQPGLLLEGAGVGGNVDGILPEHVQRDDLQRTFVGRRQHHGGGGAIAVRP